MTEKVLVPCSSIIGRFHCIFFFLCCREIRWENVDWIRLALGGDVLYILKSNPHLNLICASFCRFFK